ncbi:hypothetical protein ACWEGM_27600, partial [Streptomyces nigra]
ACSDGRRWSARPASRSPTGPSCPCATGADDHGTLKALGLVAGTALLLGGAVFTFLPGRPR